ncbi:chymotrypsin-C-like [Ixodes scapularis]
MCTQGTASLLVDALTRQRKASADIKTVEDHRRTPPRKTVEIGKSIKQQEWKKASSHQDVPDNSKSYCVPACVNRDTVALFATLDGGVLCREEAQETTPGFGARAQLQNKTIKPVCLPDIDDNPDCDVPMYVAGWGYTEPLIRKNQSLSKDMDGSHAKEDLTTVNSGSEKKSQEVTEDTTEYFDYEDVATPGSSFKNKFPDMLQEARVRLIPNEECDKLYNDSSLHGNIVCAMHDFGSICSGDGGGPLVYKTKDDRWTLMGLITATELPCNVTDLPMYFVRIKSFMDNFILPHRVSECEEPPSDTKGTTSRYGYALAAPLIINTMYAVSSLAAENTDKGKQRQ